MSRLVLDYGAIMHNISAVDAMVRDHGAQWTLATNVLSGNRDSLEHLVRFGVGSLADTRLSHVVAISEVGADTETWYMRLPDPGVLPSIVAHAEVSLNSQLEVIAGLDAAAAAAGRRHAVVLMVEIGDLSEGIFAGDLVEFYGRALEFPNIDVLGLGANLGFRVGVGPNVDQLNQLALFRELLELKFDTDLPIVSAGTSAVLPLLATGSVPAAINHFRVGESVFLGSDLVNGGVIPGFRTDCAVLEAPVVEVKRTTLYYQGSESSVNPFEAFRRREYAPGERGFRAVVGVGQVDTETAGLEPEDTQCIVLGAGSDLIVVDLGPDGNQVRVGDVMRFRPSYRALMRLMASPYIEKIHRVDGVQERRPGEVLAPVRGVLPRDDSNS